MGTFSQQSFNQFVLDNDVYGFFEKAITLKSGRQSHFYANWRTVVEDAWLTEKLVDYVLAFTESLGLKVDTFYGVPEGATKLGVLTQYTSARRQNGFARGSHVLAMGRARPKEHGAPRDRFFVGAPRGRVVVIEDVTTTGGSSLTTLNGLREAGAEVVALLSLTNRMEKRDDGRSVKEAVEEIGIAFYHMSSALDLLPLVVRKLNPASAIIQSITSEFHQYGVAELKL